LPELPDVEGFRRQMERWTRGRRVSGVHVWDRELLRNSSPQALGRTLHGAKLRPERHGKWLLARVREKDATILLHFGMTGLLAWDDAASEPHRHDRLGLTFGDRELRYRNMRRFGGYWLARDGRELDAITGPLGPDAIAVGEDEFLARLGARRGGAKAALMDQRLVAGLGNLLVDEILWRARVAPRREIQQVDAHKLYRTMSSVLDESLEHERVPPIEGWLTGARDSRDARCPRCGRKLRKETVAGRTTAWCPRCQRPG
jgi:formamidopyrimidine-DNA glycosylase